MRRRPDDALPQNEDEIKKSKYRKNWIERFYDAVRINGSDGLYCHANVGGDGKLDIVSGETWYKAPRGSKHHFWDISGKWSEHTMDIGYPSEFAEIVDLVNDGKQNEILPEFGDLKAPRASYERDHHGGVTKHVVPARSYGHGIGAGEINGDGRNDILTPNGWLESPADLKSENSELHGDWKLGN